MTISTAEAAAAPAMAAIHQASFDLAWNTEAFLGLIGSPGVFALADQPATGFIVVRVAADEAEVLTIAVSHDGRRLGLGRRLLRAAQQRAAAHGAGALFLEVASDNQSALALYESEGFAQVGRRPSYYERADGGRVDALILRKALSAAA